MLLVVWRASARDDLAQIIRHIAFDSPAAARRMRTVIETAVLPAAKHPFMYRKSERAPGLREIVAHPNYVVLYSIGATHIEVINVVHARQKYPHGNAFD